MAKTVSAIKFSAKLSRPIEGGDWTFLRLPQAASDQLNTRNMVSVEGKLNGFCFEATLRPDSEGGHWLRLEPAWSEGAGVRPADTVQVEMSQVTVQPEPEVPDDLRQALASSAPALSVWESTTAIARRDWIEWLTSGKKAETRIIRLNKMIDMLSHGKKRICCFDRSGLASKGFSCPVAADE